MTHCLRQPESHNGQFLLHLIGYKCILLFFFFNEVMLSVAHDSWCDDEHQ